MNKCNTCKSWKLLENTKFNVCTNRHLYELQSSEAAPDEDLVYPYQEDGYFKTGKNFGCVHHT